MESEIIFELINKAVVDKVYRFPYIEKPPSSIVEFIALAIITDLRTRGGFESVFEDVPFDTREVMIDDLVSLINYCLTSTKNKIINERDI